MKIDLDQEHLAVFITKAQSVLLRLIALSLLLVVVSWLKKDALPAPYEIDRRLSAHPVQEPTSKKPFTIKANGEEYRIESLYSYQLCGLIVSYHHSSSFSDYYHSMWKDYINSKDIAVVWGDNARKGIYEKMTFRSGSWTAYFNFKPGTSPQDQARFDGTCFSNNHLIADDARIVRSYMSAGKGDQICLQGYLVNYADARGKNVVRHTSTTRDDMGCEVIYVSDFKVIKKANVFWRFVHRLSFFLFGVLLFLLFGSSLLIVRSRGA